MARKSDEDLKGHISELVEQQDEAIKGFTDLVRELDTDELSHLTPKEQKFIQGMVAYKGNVDAASKFAGISARNGYRWAEKPEIKHGMNLHRSKLLSKAKITPEMVIANIARVAFEHEPKKHGMRHKDVLDANLALAKIFDLYGEDKDAGPQVPEINFTFNTDSVQVDAGRAHDQEDDE